MSECLHVTVVRDGPGKWCCDDCQQPFARSSHPDQLEVTLDEERLARAILNIRVGVPPHSQFGSSKDDLDWGWEWYDSPRKMAADIAREYAALADTQEEPRA